MFQPDFTVCPCLTHFLHSPLYREWGKALIISLNVAVNFVVGWPQTDISIVIASYFEKGRVAYFWENANPVIIIFSLIW